MCGSARRGHVRWPLSSSLRSSHQCILVGRGYVSQLCTEDRHPNGSGDDTTISALERFCLQASHLDPQEESQRAGGLPAFCAQLERAIARSKARGRIAIVIADNLGTHPPTRSKLVRTLLLEHQEALRLVYTPAWDPDSNGIEPLWRVSRREATHNHQR